MDEEFEEKLYDYHNAMDAIITNNRAVLINELKNINKLSDRDYRFLW